MHQVYIESETMKRKLEECEAQVAAKRLRVEQAQDDLHVAHDELNQAIRQLDLERKKEHESDNVRLWQTRLENDTAWNEFWTGYSTAEMDCDLKDKLDADIYQAYCHLTPDEIKSVVRFCLEHGLHTKWYKRVKYFVEFERVVHWPSGSSKPAIMQTLTDGIKRLCAEIPHLSVLHGGYSDRDYDFVIFLHRQPEWPQDQKKLVTRIKDGAKMASTIHDDFKLPEAKWTEIRQLWG